MSDFCKYQSPGSTPEMINCSNTEKLVILGEAPVENTCHVCPYRERPDMRGLGDLVSRGLEVVGITKERVAKATGRKKKGCGCEKRQQSLNKLVPFTVPCDVKLPKEKELQFCWCYWHKGAKGDELRWSIRSVEKFYKGNAKVTIVGDRPPWFTGHVIKQPRIQKCPNHSYRDMIAKVIRLSSDPEVNSTFIWMMDDINLIKPTSFQQLAEPRAVPWAPSTRNSWQRRKRYTMLYLQKHCDRKLPMMDFATHLPHATEKTKLADIVKKYDLKHNTMLWENLYGNEYRCKPQPLSPFFRRLTERYSSVSDIEQTAQHAHVMNYTQRAWNNTLRMYFMEQYPDPSKYEKI